MIKRIIVSKNGAFNQLFADLVKLDFNLLTFADSTDLISKINEMDGYSLIISEEENVADVIKKSKKPDTPFIIEKSELENKINSNKVFEKISSYLTPPSDVILVNDDEDYRHLLKWYLESKNCSVKEYDSADQIPDEHTNLPVIDSKLSNLEEVLSRQIIPESKKNVLVVDSDTEYKNLLESRMDFLKNIGFDYTGSINEAMNMIDNKKYDLIFVNMVLPEEKSELEDGNELIKWIKERKHAAVISTARYPFLKSEHSDLHIQKGYENYLFKSWQAVIGFLYNHKFIPKNYFEFSQYSNMEKSYESLKVNTLEELESLTGISMLNEKIANQRTEFSKGIGGKDKGKASNELILDTIIKGIMVCREAAQKNKIKSVNKIEPRMQQIYNAEEESGNQISFSEALFKAVQYFKQDEEEEQPPTFIKQPETRRIYVLISPSGSGKTTQALKLENILNNTVYIGNIKSGQPRIEEQKLKKDTYIDEILSNPQHEYSKYESFSSYLYLDPNKLNKRQLKTLTKVFGSKAKLKKEFPKRNYSKDPDIIEALDNGQDVILVRPLEGLMSAEKLAEHINQSRTDYDVRLISFRMDCPQGELSKRLDQRKEKEGISDKSHLIRQTLLELSIHQYNQRKQWDYDISTNKSEEETTKNIIDAIEKDRKENPYTHAEINNYIRNNLSILFKKQLNSIDDLSRLNQYELNFEINKKHLKKADIVNFEERKGLLVFYLNPFYNQKKTDSEQKIRNEVETRKKEFIEYIKEQLGEEPKKQNEKYGANPSSGYAGTMITYKNSNLAAFGLDDVLMFSMLEPDRPTTTTLSGEETHSIAFVCLEQKYNKKKHIFRELN